MRGLLCPLGVIKPTPWECSTASSNSPLRKPRRHRLHWKPCTQLFSNAKLPMQQEIRRRQSSRINDQEGSKMHYSVEQERKVHMDTIARGCIQQDVLSMPVTQANDVAHHGPDSRGSGEG